MDLVKFSQRQLPTTKEYKGTQRRWCYSPKQLSWAPPQTWTSKQRQKQNCFGTMGRWPDSPGSLRIGWWAETIHGALWRLRPGQNSSLNAFSFGTVPPATDVTKWASGLLLHQHFCSFYGSPNHLSAFWTVMEKCTKKCDRNKLLMWRHINVLQWILVVMGPRREQSEQTLSKCEIWVLPFWGGIQLQPCNSKLWCCTVIVVNWQVLCNKPAFLKDWAFRGKKSDEKMQWNVWNNKSLSNVIQTFHKQIGTDAR